MRLSVHTPASDSFNRLNVHPACPHTIRLNMEIQDLGVRTSSRGGFKGAVYFNFFRRAFPLPV
jgi:hypothetical protein